MRITFDVLGFSTCLFVGHNIFATNGYHRESSPNTRSWVLACPVGSLWVTRRLGN